MPHFLVPQLKIQKQGTEAADIVTERGQMSLKILPLLAFTVSNKQQLLYEQRSLLYFAIF